MYSDLYLAYDRAVPVIRHKDSLLDFFSYMRQRAKLSHINEMAASLSFTTILSIVPMVTVSFALLTVIVESKPKASAKQPATTKRECTIVFMSLYYPILYYFAIPESKGAKYFDCSHLSHIPSLSWSYP